MNLDFTDVLIILLIVAINLLIIYQVIRLAVDTKKQLWNQKQQINLLIKLIEKSGYSDTEVDEIKKENNAVPPGFFDI